MMIKFGMYVRSTEEQGQLDAAVAIMSANYEHISTFFLFLVPNFSHRNQDIPEQEI